MTTTHASCCALLGRKDSRHTPLLLAHAAAERAADHGATRLLAELAAMADGARWPAALYHAVVLAHRAAVGAASPYATVLSAAATANGLRLAHAECSLARRMVAACAGLVPQVLSVRAALRHALARLVREAGPLLGPLLFACVVGYLAGPEWQRFAPAVAGAAVSGPGVADRVAATRLLRGVLYAVLGPAVLVCFPTGTRKRPRR